MNNVKTLVREHHGSMLEAKITEDNGSYNISYYINGSYKHSETYVNSTSLFQVEKIANDWLNANKVLNG